MKNIHQLTGEPHVTKTTIAPHLLPTDDLRHRLEREVGGLTISCKNRGLDWLFYDLDGRTICAHYFPAQSLLNVHDGGSARPTFQANGVAPDDIPGLLAKHLDRDEDGPLREALLGSSEDAVPVASDLSDRQRDLLVKLVLVLAANPEHANKDAAELVRYARALTIEAMNIQLQDDEPAF